MRLFWDLEVSLKVVGFDRPQFFSVFILGFLSLEGPFFIGILNIGTSFENEFWSRQTAASLCRFISDI